MDRKEATGNRAERAVRRYLDLLRDALLDEHYLENELRIEHLLECVNTGEDVDYGRLCEPGPLHGHGATPAAARTADR